MRPSTSSKLRQLIDGCVLTLVAILLASTWHARVFVVSGPSMAETLLGKHYQLTCGTCGIAYRSDAEQPEMSGKRAICPNCGDATRRLDAAPQLSADAVLVDRTAFLTRSPRRWELAAFRGADRASQTLVKRVAGLPGEAIELRHGDVYANGVIQRKTMQQQRAMAVPVYDSRHEPPSVRSRWLPDAADSGWRQAGSRIRHAARTTSNEETIDWLTYHHRRRAGPPETMDESPIADDCGYNQTNPVTELHIVRDLMVRCHLWGDDAAIVLWLLTDGISQFLVELNFSASTVSVIQDGRRLGERSELPYTAGEAVLCELALCDQQVLLAIDERDVLRLPYEPPDLPFRPTSRPVAIGTRASDLEIWDLVLLRDVYYTPPRRGGTTQDRLGQDEYFVLGDNSRASLDSRNWSPPGIASESLVGKPVVAWPSNLRAKGRAWQFQVPALSRLRYIR